MSTEISKKFIKVSYKNKKNEEPKEQWFLASIPEEYHTIRHHFMYSSDDTDSAKAKLYLNDIRKMRTDSITFTPITTPVKEAQYNRSMHTGRDKKLGIPYRGGTLPVFYVSFHKCPQMEGTKAYVNADQYTDLTDSMRKSIKEWFRADLQAACTEELLAFLKEDAITQYKERVMKKLDELLHSIVKLADELKTL